MSRALVAAIGFLTRLPVPPVREPAAFARAVRWYPAAGLAVGGVVLAAGWAGARVDPWIGAAAALIAWVAVTGALHLDGLADLADGLGAAHGDRARMLRVMAEPTIGSFGTVAIGLLLLAKLVLLHALGPVWTVAAVPAIARIGPIAWARALPPLKPGLAATVAGEARMQDVIGWFALVAALGVAAPALLAGPPLIWAWQRWVRRRLGGVSGDVHGAGIELVETGLLLALASL